MLTGKHGEPPVTLRTTDRLKCECGHEGTLETAENDQPYSEPWTHHKLEGFSGQVTDWKLDHVRCPSCGQVGKVKYAQGS